MAKYLRNLDPNSAAYDPKSRTMKENPFDNDENDYQGDEALKKTGDYIKFVESEELVNEYNRTAR